MERMQDAPARQDNTTPDSVVDDRTRERLDPRDPCRILRDAPQVERELPPHPSLGRVTEESCQANGHVGRQIASLLQQRSNPVPRDLQAIGELVRRHAQRRKNRVAQHRARVRRPLAAIARRTEATRRRRWTRRDRTSSTNRRRGRPSRTLGAADPPRSTVARPKPRA
jgi:hypothetical protein